MFENLTYWYTLEKNFCFKLSYHWVVSTLKALHSCQTFLSKLLTSKVAHHCNWQSLSSRFDSWVPRAGVSILRVPPLNFALRPDMLTLSPFVSLSFLIVSSVKMYTIAFSNHLTWVTWQLISKKGNLHFAITTFNEKCISFQHRRSHSCTQEHYESAFSSIQLHLCPVTFVLFYLINQHTDSCDLLMSLETLWFVF